MWKWSFKKTKSHTKRSQNVKWTSHESKDTRFDMPKGIHCICPCKKLFYLPNSKKCFKWSHAYFLDNCLVHFGCVFCFKNVRNITENGTLITISMILDTLYLPCFINYYGLLVPLITFIFYWFFSYSLKRRKPSGKSKRKNMKDKK